MPTTRRFLVAASAILLFAAGAAGLVAWFTREAPRVLDATPPPAPGEAVPGPLVEPLPLEPVARERALETNEARQRLDELRRGFLAGSRTPASEARLLPALDALFPAGSSAFGLECRGLLCRLEVEAAVAEWQAPFAGHGEVRRHAERVTFDPDGVRIAFVELVPVRVADGAERPEGERILDDLEERLRGSEAARGCLAEGPGGGEAEVRLTIERSGVTYRFGSGTASAVAYCLMMEAMPDVVGGISAPEGVRRAERRVRLSAAR